MTNYFERPVFGFIVEGKGEFVCYPSLVSRIVNATGLHIKCLAAKGYGNIIKNFEEHIADIITTHKPIYVITTIDLFDCKNFEKCCHLKAHLQNILNHWVEKNKSNTKYQPFPEGFSVVIQIQSFETWLISDKKNIARIFNTSFSAEENEWTNVEIDVPNPGVWIKTHNHNKTVGNCKRPSFCKTVFSSADITKMLNVCPSFYKFSKEVIKYYNLWDAKIVASN